MFWMTWRRWMKEMLEQTDVWDSETEVKRESKDSYQSICVNVFVAGYQPPRCCFEQSFRAILRWSWFDWNSSSRGQLVQRVTHHGWHHWWSFRGQCDVTRPPCTTLLQLSLTLAREPFTFTLVVRSSVCCVWSVRGGTTCPILVSLVMRVGSRRSTSVDMTSSLSWVIYEDVSTSGEWIACRIMINLSPVYWQNYVNSMCPRVWTWPLNINSFARSWNILIRSASLTSNIMTRETRIGYPLVDLSETPVSQMNVFWDSMHGRSKGSTCVRHWPFRLVHSWGKLWPRLKGCQSHLCLWQISFASLKN